MPYDPFPNRKIGYDHDGTSVWHGTPGDGPIAELSQSQKEELNDTDTVIVHNHGASSTTLTAYRYWWFFPEPKTITHVYPVFVGLGTNTITQWDGMQGSVDTTNGMDGTWSNATFSGGNPVMALTPSDRWRTTFYASSFPTPVRAVRISVSLRGGTSRASYMTHLYGTKGSGETPHDLVFIDGGTEFPLPLDFGDVTRGTEYVEEVRVRNVSTSKTALNVEVSLPPQNPSVAWFSISDSLSGPWVASLPLGSIGPESNSSPIYVRSHPGITDPGGPSMVPLQVTADAGFFE